MGRLVLFFSFSGALVHWPEFNVFFPEVFRRAPENHKSNLVPILGFSK